MLDEVLGGQHGRDRVRAPAAGPASASAAAALTAGMMLSAFCRCLVVLEDDELVAGHRGAGLARRPARSSLSVLAAGAGRAGLTAGRGRAAARGRGGRGTGCACACAPAFCVPWRPRPPRVSGGRTPAATIEPPVRCAQSHRRTRCASVTCAVASERDAGSGRFGRRHVARPRRPRKRQPPRPGRQRPRHQHQQRLGQQRQRRRSSRAPAMISAVVLLAEAEVDDPAEPAAADQRGQRRRWRPPARPPSGRRS